MSKTNLTQFECDICHAKALGPSSGVPTGWVEFTIDGMIDREWYDKAICVSCLKTIDAVRDKQRKATP